jgi:GTP-binding protein EngB required for normal cell division
LIDARRGTSQFDRNVMGWFDEADVAYSIIITKADRVSKSQVVRFVNDVCMRYHSQHYDEQQYGSQSPIVHVTSSARQSGIVEVMSSIDAEFVGHFEKEEDDDEPEDDEDEDEDEDKELTND